MIIQDKNGTEFEAFAQVVLTGAQEVIDVMVSAPSREILEQVALDSNLMVQGAEGTLRDAPNCASDWIGHPAPGSDYLVNWRLGPRHKLGRDEDGHELWQLTCAAWALQGVAVQLTDTLRAYELHGVRQIDGKAVQTPLRVWAQ